MSRHGRRKARRSDRRWRIEVARREGRVPAQHPRAEHAQTAHREHRAGVQKCAGRRHWIAPDHARSTWNALARFESDLLDRLEQLDPEAAVLRVEPSQCGLSEHEAPYLFIAAHVHARSGLASRDPSRVQFQDRAQASLRLAPQLDLDGGGTAARNDADEIGTVHELSRARQPEKLPRHA